METRKDKFMYLMKILDEAEGERDSEVGSFSFLWDKSYVREVVSSPGIKTSIAGLKTFLATEVLDIYGAKNDSNMTYRDIQAQINGEKGAKKYSFFFEFMDSCFDIEKNREAMLRRCQELPDEEGMRKSIAETKIWIPYLFMDKLREVVWNKLRAFFKLCDQTSCSECEKKSEVYFQFIQAVALYEIFYIEFVQEKASTLVEESMVLIQKAQEELGKLGKQGERLSSCENMPAEELLQSVQELTLGYQNIWNNLLEDKVWHVGIFQLLIAEFGISLNAMCYLLMILEAMNVSSGRMRGLKNISVQIQKNLANIYEKDLEILQNYNKKRAKRYRQVNVKLEAVLEKYVWPKYQEYDEATIIYTFMEELCKPSKDQKAKVLRGLECMLGYPVYKELERKEQNTIHRG